ncbi:hypothetical protein NQ318_002880 [Aromia moschata]|uniref:EF-hand domain-containing protein n=1 Tax=Aromia moschata TaxID=1265417 RepID=A0AAV8Y889_9CUCU|nr:hypothetical protein NQ318_002880 [Aromia moschata]
MKYEPTERKINSQTGGFKKASAAPRKKSGPKFELSEEQKVDIREAFDLFDSEGSGKIGRKRFKSCNKSTWF